MKKRSQQETIEKFAQSVNLPKPEVTKVKSVMIDGISLDLFQKVQSSNIRQVYRPSDNDILYILFHNERSYYYNGVGLATYQSLLTSASPGKFFNAFIKEAYSSGEAKITLE